MASRQYLFSSASIRGAAFGGTDSGKRLFSKTSQRHLITGLAVLAAGLAGACAPVKTYPGPELSANETAVISGQFVPLNIGTSKIMVAPINEGAGELLSEPLMAGYSHPVAVLPGNQNLLAAFCAPSGATLSCRDRRLLQFEAEAGHSYAVEGSDHDHIWVVDTDTGEVVLDVRSVKPEPIPTSEATLAEAPAPEAAPTLSPVADKKRHRDLR